MSSTNWFSLQPDEVRGVEALSAHGKMLFGELDPAGRLGRALRMRFERDRDGARIRLPLPGLDPETLEVSRVEDELVIGVAGRRRKIALPVGFSTLEVDRVSYRDENLIVSFCEPRAGMDSTLEAGP